jgi:hypothetical protein
MELHESFASFISNAEAGLTGATAFDQQTPWAGSITITSSGPDRSIPPVLYVAGTFPTAALAAKETSPASGGAAIPWSQDLLPTEIGNGTIRIDSM